MPLLFSLAGNNTGRCPFSQVYLPPTAPTRQPRPPTRIHLSLNSSDVIVYSTTFLAQLPTNVSIYDCNSILRSTTFSTIRIVSQQFKHDPCNQSTTPICGYIRSSILQPLSFSASSGSAYLCNYLLRCNSLHCYFLAASFSTSFFAGDKQSKI